MDAFQSYSDDFAVSVAVVTKLDVPLSREGVLHYLDAVRRRHPDLTDFDRRADTEHVLETDRDQSGPGCRSKWLTVDLRRVAAGLANPPDAATADALVETVLVIAPPHFGLGPLDTESLDLTYTFDFACSGNPDEVVAAALAAGGPLEPFTRLPGSRLLQFQPAITLALDEGCQLQARLAVETRSSAYQVRTGQFAEAPITVSLGLRQFWGRQPFPDFVTGYRHLRRTLDVLVTDWVLPGVLQPVERALSAR